MRQSECVSSNLEECLRREGDEPAMLLQYSSSITSRSHLETLSHFGLVLIALSSGILMIAGVRVLVQDIARRGKQRKGKERSPDSVDLLIDIAVILIGTAGVIGVLRRVEVF